MVSAAHRKAQLSHGIGLEQAGAWDAAHVFWSQSAARDPNEPRYPLRGAAAALRIRRPELAFDALVRARDADHASQYCAQLDKLAQSARRLDLSLLRSDGMAAFEAGDFETARLRFERLSAAAPDHPWAAAKARIATGLAPGFMARLQREQPDVRQRVFLTGCGRSGTWLLAAMVSGLKSVHMARGEQPLGAFLDMPDAPVTHLVKRPHDAHLHFDRIPAAIKVLHVVRHPFDVLSSRHRGTDHHISMARLEAELRGFFAQLHERPNTCVVAYEDMVLWPDAVEAKITHFLRAAPGRAFRDFHVSCDLPDDIVDAMHGLRPLDPSALHRWRDCVAARAYLRDQMQHSDGTLTRFAACFGYDIDL